mmetsp:Transcript_123177/g.353904  ORF Transcript_123177/g.353904 Transcript_123177/m.353904 type:complete len:231 (-) Transcript_123177:808-1500(-)
MLEHELAAGGAAASSIPPLHHDLLHNPAPRILDVVHMTARVGAALSGQWRPDTHEHLEILVLSAQLQHRLPWRRRVSASGGGSARPRGGKVGEAANGLGAVTEDQGALGAAEPRLLRVREAEKGWQFAVALQVDEGAELRGSGHERGKLAVDVRLPHVIGVAPPERLNPTASCAQDVRQLRRPRPDGAIVQHMPRAERVRGHHQGAQEHRATHALAENSRSAAPRHAEGP